MIIEKRIPVFLLTLIILSLNTLRSQNESFTMSTIGSASLLNKPWDLHYGPDGYLWVTEREDGIVSRINPETAEKDVLIQIPDVYAPRGQDGLLGIALHEDFLAGSPYVYLSYTRLVQNQRRQRIVRYSYESEGNDGTLSSPFILVDHLPASDDHNSGRLIFGVDGKLYYTIGDQGVKDCNANLAQKLPSQDEIDAMNWSDYPGKILRINTDGSIPEDNPVIDGVQSHIYSYGHRNPQGIVMSATGLLYSDEHGPSSDDEVNLIIAGKNYGWPFVAGIKDNLMYDSDGCLTEETQFNHPDYQDPLITIFTPDTDVGSCSDNWMCRPNIAPSSLDLYESSAIPQWENSLLLTSLKRGRVYRLKLNPSGNEVVGEVTEHFYTQNRYRDIAISPDGKTFYIITDESGNTADASGYQRRTSVLNPGAILKFTWDGSVSIEDKQEESPMRIYHVSSSGKLHVELNGLNEGGYSAELINTNGQTVRYALNLTEGHNEINVEDLPSGVYFFKLKANSKFWMERVFVE